MANRYWVGGTADWDATAGTKWSTTSGGAGGSAVPTSSDDVFFDANSGAVTVTVISSNMKNLDFSGFAGTLAGGASLDCRGSLVVSSGMTYSHTGDLSFGATSGTQTITTNGKTLTSQISFVGVGGTWQLSDSLTTTNSAGITLTDGTFNANNFDVTCVKFNSSNSNTRTLTMGSGTFTITGTGTAWDFGTVTNLTLTANTSTVKFTSAVATSMRFDGGGKTYYNIWHAGGTGTNNVLEMFGSNTFNNIKLNAGTYMDFNGSTTQTVSSLTIVGTAGSNCFLRSFNTTVYTISDTSGTNNVQHCNISYCTASGGATFNATNSTDGGNNTGWNFLGNIAFDATSSSFSQGTGSLTWSHTCSGSDRVLFVFVPYMRGSFSSFSCTYNGTAMTLLTNSGNTVNNVYMLLNPSTGANNVVFTVSGSDANASILGTSISYNGCKTSSQPDSSNLSGASGGGSGSLSDTGSTTVVASGCWLVGFANTRYAQNSSSDMTTSNRTTRVTQTKDNYGQSGVSGGTLVYDSNGVVGTGSQTGAVATNSNATALDNYLISLEPLSYTPPSSSNFLGIL